MILHTNQNIKFEFYNQMNKSCNLLSIKLDETIPPNPFITKSGLEYDTLELASLLILLVFDSKWFHRVLSVFSCFKLEVSHINSKMAKRPTVWGSKRH